MEPTSITHNDLPEKLSGDKHISLYWPTKIKKGYVDLTPGPNVIKLFTSVIYQCLE